MKRYQVVVAGQTYDVEVLGDPLQEEVEVSVDGETLAVHVSSSPTVDERPTVAPSPEAMPAPAVGAPYVPSAPSGAVPRASNVVTSPLPGVIKTIAVQPGEKVSANDELIVIEAMKMDNVIRSVRAGTIRTVHVAEGRQVSHGEPLLDYED